MCDEVELNLEDFVAMGNSRGGQASRVDVQSHFPPVVDARSEGEADFADDLRPHVKGCVGVLPGGEREFGPDVRAGDIRKRGHKKTSASDCEMVTPIGRGGLALKPIS